MSNEFFTATGVPGSHAAGLSSDIRGELLAVEQGFNKLPILAGNAGKVVVVNPSETGLLSDPNNLVRESDIAQGDNIVVTASGSQFIQSTGSYFIVTSAGGFDVTGFNTTNIMKIFTMLLPGGLNLVDSATFRLRDRKSRRSIPGEILRLVNDTTTGAFIELGEAKVLDMTGYSGADISLGIGQVAVYDLTAATTLAFRVATAESHIYELDISPIATNSSIGGVLLNPNNAAASNISYSQINVTAPSSVSGSRVAGGGSFSLSIGAAGLHNLTATITTNIQAKQVKSWYTSSTATANISGHFFGEWLEYVTAWTSLGTLAFNQTMTAHITLRRVA